MKSDKLKVKRDIERIEIYLEYLKEDFDEEIKPTIHKIFSSYGKTDDNATFVLSKGQSSLSGCKSSLEHQNENDIDLLLSGIRNDVIENIRNNDEKKIHIKTYINENLRMLRALGKFYERLSKDIEEI